MCRAGAYLGPGQEEAMQNQAAEPRYGSTGALGESHGDAGCLLLADLVVG